MVRLLQTHLPELLLWGPRGVCEVVEQLPTGEVEEGELQPVCQVLQFVVGCDPVEGRVVEHVEPSAV